MPMMPPPTPMPPSPFSAFSANIHIYIHTPPRVILSISDPVTGLPIELRPIRVWKHPLDVVMHTLHPVVAPLSDLACETMTASLYI